MKKHIDTISKIEFITPQKAKEYLLINENSRPIDIYKVGRFKRMMENGEWELKGVIFLNFTDKLTMTNGQHRMKALSMSNVEGINFNVSKSIISYK